MLGARIAVHLLKRDDADVRLLVRRQTMSDPEKRESLQAFVGRGATLVEADVQEPATLASATADVDVVVSALQGDRRVIVDGQVALARAAAANGARRILPSDFALDLFKATPGEQVSFDLRREADEQIAELDIEQVNVLSGAFLDGIASPGAVIRLDDDARTATFWGSGDEPFEATTVNDTARYAARVALDPDVPPGKFAVAGQRLTFNDILAYTERVTGRRYATRSSGTLDDLRTWIDDRRENGDAESVFWASYLLYMLNGQAALDDLQNDRYADIHPITLDELEPPGA